MKEAFEKAFDQHKGIPANVCTRWHSTMRQVKAIVQLDHQSLSSVVQSEGHVELAFTSKEWGQLKELVELLNPFHEATVLTKGEK